MVSRAGLRHPSNFREGFSSLPATVVLGCRIAARQGRSSIHLRLRRLHHHRHHLRRLYYRIVMTVAFVVAEVMTVDTGRVRATGWRTLIPGIPWPHTSWPGLVVRTKWVSCSYPGSIADRRWWKQLMRRRMPLKTFAKEWARAGAGR